MNLIMNGAIAIAIYAGRPGRTFGPRIRNLHVNRRIIITHAQSECTDIAMSSLLTGTPI